MSEASDKAETHITILTAVRYDRDGASRRDELIPPAHLREQGRLIQSQLPSLPDLPQQPPKLGHVDR